jgi:hypothetical protein
VAALTTLAAVKQYLSITTNGQDKLIPPLIDRESTLVEAWTGRRFPTVTNTNQRLNGTGSKMMTLQGQPVVSVSALSICGTPFYPSPDGLQSGYTFDDTTIYLIGGAIFPRMSQNVVVSYVAGYRTSETDFVPAGNTPTLTPSTGGTAMEVVSVVDNTAGAPMVEVGSAPASGQFAFDDGVFTFNPAQYNSSVTMTYGYVPGPVEQAVIEMVALDLQQRSNVGINSKSLAGETVTFEKVGLSASAKEMLRPYRMFSV